ncbi:phosphatase PAP2 family protein [Jiella sp. M17.18]|uniref:phosphatase PAP2 family protein n=1 Tax=Jiella sp. M17.18 TaxID=3234247 RepID=UPI0034DFCBAE
MSTISFDHLAVTAAGPTLAAHPWLLDLSEATASWVIFVVPATLVWLWIRGEGSARQAAVTAALSAGVALSVSGMLSFLFYVPRPFALGLAPNVTGHVLDSSFPSDHVAVMSAVAAALLIGERRWSGSAVALAALAVGAARVALGIHFPTDILAAALLGVAAASIFRLHRLNDFATFCRDLMELAYAGLGLEDVAERIHLKKHQEIT